MKTTYTKLGLALAALLVSSGMWAQTAPVDKGKVLFDNHCATCHGVEGRGNGPLAGLIRKSPTDLTQLAKQNNGILPMARMYEVIEGGAVASHGSRDMPIWGREFGMDLASYYVDVDYDAKALIRGRILLLLEYINRLQKP